MQLIFFDLLRLQNTGVKQRQCLIAIEQNRKSHVALRQLFGQGAKSCDKRQEIARGQRGHAFIHRSNHRLEVEIIRKLGEMLDHRNGIENVVIAQHG